MRRRGRGEGLKRRRPSRAVVGRMWIRVGMGVRGRMRVGRVRRWWRRWPLVEVRIILIHHLGTAHHPARARHPRAGLSTCVPERRTTRSSTIFSFHFVHHSPPSLPPPPLSSPPPPFPPPPPLPLSLPLSPSSPSSPLLFFSSPISYIYIYIYTFVVRSIEIINAKVSARSEHLHVTRFASTNRFDKDCSRDLSFECASTKFSRDSRDSLIAAMFYILSTISRETLEIRSSEGSRLF